MSTKYSLPNIGFDTAENASRLVCCATRARSRPARSRPASRPLSRPFAQVAGEDIYEDCFRCGAAEATGVELLAGTSRATMALTSNSSANVSTFWLISEHMRPTSALFLRNFQGKFSNNKKPMNNNKNKKKKQTDESMQ